MKMKMLITVVLISVLSACSSAVKPKGGPTHNKRSVADIMRGQFGAGHQRENFRKGPAGLQSAANRVRGDVDYSRSQATELNGIFPRLPNPDICMYIEPHLSMEGATIPGYTSCFSMYEKNQYALPGEMNAVWLR